MVYWALGFQISPLRGDAVGVPEPVAPAEKGFGLNQIPGQPRPAFRVEQTNAAVAVAVAGGRQFCEPIPGGGVVLCQARAPALIEVSDLAIADYLTGGDGPFVVGLGGEIVWFNARPALLIELAQLHETPDMAEVYGPREPFLGADVIPDDARPALPVEFADFRRGRTIAGVHRPLKPALRRGPPGTFRQDRAGRGSGPDWPTGGRGGGRW